MKTTAQNNRLTPWVATVLGVLVIVCLACGGWRWAKQNGYIADSVQVFTASGTWVKPDGITGIKLLALGADAAHNNGSHCKIPMDVTRLKSAAITVVPGKTSFVGDNGIVYCSLVVGVNPKDTSAKGKVIVKEFKYLALPH